MDERSKRGSVCERCRLAKGTSEYEGRWLCAACRGVLEWRRLWEDLIVPPGFQD